MASGAALVGAGRNGDEAVVGRRTGLGASWVGRGGAHRQKGGHIQESWWKLIGGNKKKDGMREARK